jgi:hypothetical protein
VAATAAWVESGKGDEGKWIRICYFKKWRKCEKKEKFTNFFNYPQMGSKGIIKHTTAAVTVIRKCLWRMIE